MKEYPYKSAPEGVKIFGEDTQNSLIVPILNY